MLNDTSFLVPFDKVSRVMWIHERGVDTTLELADYKNNLMEDFVKETVKATCSGTGINPVSALPFETQLPEGICFRKEMLRLVSEAKDKLRLYFETEPIVVTSSGKSIDQYCEVACILEEMMDHVGDDITDALSRIVEFLIMLGMRGLCMGILALAP